MDEQIAALPSQFSWQPSFEGGAPQGSPRHFIVCGMGGSHLGAILLRRHDPELPLRVHSDYGLPAWRYGGRIILSSHSGNTEEVLDTAQKASDAGLDCVAITTGGALADLARARNIPLILLPTNEVEPRMAVGHSMLAIAYAMQNTSLLGAVAAIGSVLAPQELRAHGEELATSLNGRIPLIYSSEQNRGIANFWKVAFNETTKIPAFRYPVPEFCHNELSGFDAVLSTHGLSSPLAAVFLMDTADHPRTQLRMKIAAEMLEDKGMSVSSIELPGVSALHTALSGVVIGVWTAYTLAHQYGVEDAQTPLIAAFKERMSHYV